MRYVAVVIYQLHSESAYKVDFATVACVEKGLVRLYRIFMRKKNAFALWGLNLRTSELAIWCYTSYVHRTFRCSLDHEIESLWFEFRSGNLNLFTPTTTHDNMFEFFFTMTINFIMYFRMSKSSWIFQKLTRVSVLSVSFNPSGEAWGARG